MATTRKATKKASGKSKAAKRVACAQCGTAVADRGGRDDCLGCGKPVCGECPQAARRCSACDARCCKTCLAKHFTAACPECGLGHHAACEAFLSCSQCEDFRCDDACTGSTPTLQSCESCDEAMVCTGCGMNTLGDETDDFGACPDCDVIAPALRELKRYDAERTRTEETLRQAKFVCEDRASFDAFLEKAPTTDLEEARTLALTALESAARDAEEIRLQVLGDEVSGWIPAAQAAVLRAAPVGASAPVQRRVLETLRALAPGRTKGPAARDFAKLVEAAVGAGVPAWEPANREALRALAVKFGVRFPEAEPPVPVAVEKPRSWPSGRWTVVRFPGGAPPGLLEQLVQAGFSGVKAKRPAKARWVVLLGEFFMGAGQPVLLFSPDVPAPLLHEMDEVFRMFGEVVTRKSERHKLAFRGRTLAWLEDGYERVGASDGS